MRRKRRRREIPRFSSPLMPLGCATSRRAASRREPRMAEKENKLSDQEKMVVLGISNEDELPPFGYYKCVGSTMDEEEIIIDSNGWAFYALPVLSDYTERL